MGIAGNPAHPPPRPYMGDMGDNVGRRGTESNNGIQDHTERNPLSGAANNHARSPSQPI